VNLDRRGGWGNKLKKFKKRNEKIKVYRFSCMDLYIFRR